MGVLSESFVSIPFQESSSKSQLFGMLAREWARVIICHHPSETGALSAAITASHHVGSSA